MSEPTIEHMKDESTMQNTTDAVETTPQQSTTNNDNAALEVNIDKEKSEVKDNGENNDSSTTTPAATSNTNNNSNNPPTPVTTDQSSSSSSHSTTNLSDAGSEHAPLTKFTSVKDVGVSTEKNPRFRRTMEDEHVILDNFGDIPTQGFFAVYDGHGGRGAVDFTARTLHKNLLDEINKDPNGDIQSHIKNSYIKTDEDMSNEPIQFSGTTAITALIRVNNEGERILYIANAGDARAVIAQGTVGQRLSYDHKGSDLEETKRIIEAGGFVVNNRVNGILAVTRSLGDHSMKEYVVGDPYMKSIKLDSSYTHLILACDGLWDVVSDQVAVDVLLKEKDQTAQELSDKLLLASLRNGSTDNISIMVIIL